MHGHDHDRTEEHRRSSAVAARTRDESWEAARRAAAGGDGSTVPPAAVLRLQRMAGNAGVGALLGHDEQEATSPVLGVVGKGGGSPLPTNLRADMEQQLGSDFGDVRVHDDGSAAASAAAVQAKAYTVGNEVVFNSGAYSPGSDEGRRTIAHELTHVVQQRSGPVEGTPTGDGVAVSHPQDRFEQEAEATASSIGPVAAPEPATAEAGGMSAQREMPEEEVQTVPIQREEVPEEEDVQTLPLQRQEEVPEEDEVPA